MTEPKTTSFDLELNPFERSFAPDNNDSPESNGANKHNLRIPNISSLNIPVNSTKLPGITPTGFTPGGRKLPHLLLSPGALSAPETPGGSNLWNSLLNATNHHPNGQHQQHNRSGSNPSFASNGGVNSNDTNSSYHQFLRNKTGLTPNESNLRTGLTPGGFHFGGAQLPGLTTPNVLLNSPMTPGISSLLGITLSQIPANINHQHQPGHITSNYHNGTNNNNNESNSNNNGSTNNNNNNNINIINTNTNTSTNVSANTSTNTNTNSNSNSNINTNTNSNSNSNSKSNRSNTNNSNNVNNNSNNTNSTTNSNNITTNSNNSATATTDDRYIHQTVTGTSARMTASTSSGQIINSGPINNIPTIEEKSEHTPSSQATGVSAATSLPKRQTKKAEPKKRKASVHEDKDTTTTASKKKKPDTKKKEDKESKKLKQEVDDDDIDMEGMGEDEKRKIFLERNRVAASKCRQRKKQLIQKMEDELSFYSTGYRQVSAQVNQLRNHLVNVMNIFEGHKDCPIFINSMGGFENFNNLIQQSNYLCQISGNASNNISIPSTIPTTLNNVPPSQDMGYQQQGQLQQHQQLQLHQHQHHQQPQQPLQTHQAHQSHQSHQPHQPHQSHQPPPQSMLPLAQQIQNPSENQNIQSNVNSGGPISTHHSLTDLRSANKSIVNHNNINAGSIEVGNGKFRTVNSMSNLAGAQQATFDLA